MNKLLLECKLCPRGCNANRINNEFGFCKAGKNVKLARVSLHEWEEPCISGEQGKDKNLNERVGSGTIFFSDCNLKCVFCQNYKISHNGIGKEISIERLAEIFLEQQERGAYNINLVTPTHYVPQVIEAIKIAKDNNLKLPILYNSNGYESTETIKMLEGLIDVYLPDIKYYNDKYALKYSNAPNYFHYAKQAVELMFKQVGKPIFDKKGIMQKGVIIRHLMLPGLLFDSKKVIDYIYNTFGDDVYVSIMNQYTPMHKAAEYKEINRCVPDKMYEALVDYCISIGIENAFIQEKGTNSEEFVPEFDMRGV